MANTIKLKQSAVNGKVPTTAQIQLGELAVNTYDGKLYLKKNVSGTETVVDVSGSVTTLSIASANGFAGTVATATTTPAITLSTSITGLLKGNGTAISAAAAGTDYQAPISGAATTITTSDLTASRALVSDASGKVAVSSATSTELGYLSGVTSAIQTQINNINAVSASATSKDDITTRTSSGFFQTDTATTAEGWPETTNSWYHLLTSTHSNTTNYYSMQFASSFYDSNKLYYRSTNGSGTTAWNKIWHAGNDGTGSGLDADLLDGINSGSFLRSDASTTYSGGVLTITTPAGFSGNNTGSVNTLQVYQATGGTDAFMTFHVAGDYAAHFGLDGTTNDLFWGGWSAGANKYRICHAANLGNFTHYIGTTAIALNRASGSQSLTGITSIDGSAAFVTNTNLGKTGAQGFMSTTSWTSTDWSNVPIGGCGMTVNNTPGAPNTNYGFFSKTGNRDAGGGWGGIWMDYNGPNLYFGTTTVSSTNAVWNKVWSDSNDGAGSGLDADLLDGQHGSYYAAASSLGNYLPLSGGTLTGSVVVSASSSSDALRITQTGTGRALIVEDSANPDSTPFVVDAAGDVLIGTPIAIPGAFSDVGKLQIAQNTGEAVQHAFAFTADANGSYLYLNKSRSSTIGTNSLVQSGDILGGILFAGADGTTYHRAVSIEAAVDGTPGTNDMPGRLMFSTTRDGASNPTEAFRVNSLQNVLFGRSYSGNERIGIGGATSSISTATSANGIYNDTTISSAQTNIYTANGTYLSTQAAAFTLANLRHHAAGQFTIGAGSTVTSQMGFIAENSLTGATNNYGFVSNIPSGSGRYNFYAAGTAPNYFAGRIGIGDIDTSVIQLRLSGNISGNAYSYGMYADGVVQSGVTGRASMFHTLPSTAAASFTLGQLIHFQAVQGTFGAGSTVTNQFGFVAESNLTGATNNYGFYSGMASGSGRYNFYAAGTADNYFAGRVGVGNVPTTFVSVDIQGTYPAGSFTRGFRAAATIPSSVLGNARLFSTEAYTSAATFSLTSLSHYMAFQQTIGAGSIVANQYGFSAESSLVGATYDYGFYSNIPAVGSGTGSTSSVSSVSSTGATVTINTIAAHGLSTNQTVTISLTANATALVSGVPCTILTVGTTDFTLIGASSNAVGVSFTATGVGTGSGTVTLNQQNSGKTISVVNSTQFTYSSSVSATFASISATGTITPNIRYNFYSAGTAPNFLNGDVLLGSNLALGNKDNASSISVSSWFTSTRYQGMVLYGSVTGTVPYVYGYRFSTNTLAGSSVTAAFGFYADKGTLSGTVQNQYGFYVESNLIGATNNYGFYSNIPSAAGRYNFYAAGTADNYFEGNVKTNGTLAGGYLAHAAGTTAMALGADKVVKITPNATATYTTTVAPAGATASIIIVTSGTTSYTITFGTGFLTTGTLATGTVTAKTFVISFVSDGTTMIETSRTVAM